MEMKEKASVRLGHKIERENNLGDSVLAPNEN